MTAEELNDKLKKYSPFKYEGSSDELLFDGKVLLINGKPTEEYDVTDTEKGLQINTKGIFVFQQNVIIDFGKDDQVTIINHNVKSLVQYPGKSRHPSATDGYLTLKSHKIDN